MKISYFIYLILAVLLGSGISAAGLYFGQILPLQTRLDEMQYEASDALIRNAGFDVFTAVSLRESDREIMLKTFDDKILPSDIQVFDKFIKENRMESLHCQYLLWRIKKYSKDFSVKFPEAEMEILNNIPEERPKFPGKIGNE